MNLVAFLLEKDAQPLDELNRLGDHYYYAYPNSCVQKATPFNAFECEGNSEFSDEEMERYVAQKFARDNPHQGKSWKKVPLHHFRSCSEQRTGQTDPPNPPERRFKDYSNNRGCRFCGSWRHEELACPYQRKDDDGNSLGDGAD